METKSARLWFSKNLHIFLTIADKGGPQWVTFKGAQSAKHLIESAGIPHTEVARIDVNRTPESINYIVQNQDFIEVFSFLDLPITQRTGPNHEWQCILDNHLGKLASYLRMLGFDSYYDPTLDDEELALLSYSTNRVLLTRDRRLLMRKIVTNGYFVRSKDPLQQAREIVHRYQLTNRVSPFERCIRCNHILTPVDKMKIIHLLQPKTKLYYNQFQACSHCGQVYWQGSHYEPMLEMIDEILNETHEVLPS